MTIGTLIVSSAVLLVTVVTCLAEAEPEEPRDTFPKWAFCVAYQIRNADERDTRPVGPSAEPDPFNVGGTWIPQTLIGGRDVVDVAALTTRQVKCGALKQQVAEEAIRGATAGTKRHPIAECYNPHHLFVFYGYEGQPVAAIEPCFSCNKVRITPTIFVPGTGGSFETADLVALAKIASDAGLDLHPFASFDAYVESLNESAKLRIERAKQAEGKPE